MADSVSASTLFDGKDLESCAHCEVRNWLILLLGLRSIVWGFWDLGLRGLKKGGGGGWGAFGGFRDFRDFRGFGVFGMVSFFWWDRGCGGGGGV